MCVICGTVIKSDLIWNAHLQSKSHKQIIELSKSQAIKRPSATSVTENSHIPVKKSNTNSVLPTETALVSGYAESSSDDEVISKTQEDTKSKTSKLKSIISNKKKAATSKSSTSNLPSDFYDSKVPSSIKAETTESVKPSIPEGFFDDPYQDAIIRQVPYKNKLDEEFELFQKAMNHLDHKADKLVEEDDEHATTTRNLGEIEEQIHLWTKVNQLELKKEELSQRKKREAGKETTQHADEEEDDDDIEIDSLDWRMKKS